MKLDLIYLPCTKLSVYFSGLDISILGLICLVSGIAPF